MSNPFETGMGGAEETGGKNFIKEGVHRLRVTAVKFRPVAKSFKGAKLAQAEEVGKRLAAAAKKAGVESVVFDRGGYLYHGRVKALADGAREGGLIF